MKNILLVFGGKSYEHDISVVTAAQIYQKTKLSDFNLIPLYISRDNKFYIYKQKKFNLKDFVVEKDIKNSKFFKEVAFVFGENGKLFSKTCFGLKEQLSVDTAIIACHGGAGENGKLISFFESFGIKTSSGNFDSLAVCMNKFLFKQIMKGEHICVAPGTKICKTDYEKNKKNIMLGLRFFKFPLVIKPNSGGSSIGLFLAKNKNDFMEKIEAAFEFDECVIVEKFIKNTREFNVAILGDKNSFEVSEIDEPLKKGEVLSFENKYLSVNNKSTKNSMVGQVRNFPAKIEIWLKNKIQSIAKKIFVDLNLSGIIRFDFLYDTKADKLYVCEVNAVPGSLAFYFFDKNRILANDLVLKLIEIANKNYVASNRFNADFVTNILPKN